MVEDGVGQEVPVVEDALDWPRSALVGAVVAVRAAAGAGEVGAGAAGAGAARDEAEQNRSQSPVGADAAPAVGVGRGVVLCRRLPGVGAGGGW